MITHTFYKLGWIETSYAEFHITDINTQPSIKEVELNPLSIRAGSQSAFLPNTAYNKDMGKITSQKNATSAMWPKLT